MTTMTIMPYALQKYTQKLPVFQEEAIETHRVLESFC